MQILEQSCKKPQYHNVKRIMILCDRDGFANMKEFLLETLKDCVCYIDESDVVMEDLFVFTEDSDYFISCNDSTFYNLVNVILCQQEASTRLKNIPSVFYDMFVEPEYEKFRTQFRDICNIDYHVLEGCLDNNTYEIFDEMDLYDVSETTLRRHVFVGVELVTNNIVAEKIKGLFNHPLFCYDHDIKDAFVIPAKLSKDTKEYEKWYNLMLSILKVREEFINSNMSCDMIRSCMPGCAAKKVTIITDLDEWDNFFKNIEKLRVITNSDDRELIRKLSDYFLDYAYIESLKTLLKNMVNTIDSYEELPF